MGDPYFDPEIHICKFGFEYYSFISLNSRYSILGDMYLKELKIDFWEFQADRSKKITDTVGFEISDAQVNELLPLLRVEEYEKYRDLPEGWERKIGEYGYRDGWGYNFWYTSEYGTPLFQADMSAVFSKKNLPPYEKLLDWLSENYKNDKRLKKKEILW